MAHSASPTSQADLAVANTQPGATVAQPKTIRILLAGDATGAAAQALRALYAAPEHALELTAVSSVTTLIPTLVVVDPEVILLDLAVCYPNLKETFRRVRRAAPHVPLIVLSDESQKEDAKLALDEGAMDYVLREYMNDATLSRVLRSALERNTLEGLADFLRDPVTGLYTRDGMLTLGSSTMDISRRNRGSMALFCVLVQNLQRLREAEGHAAADHVLQDVTAALTTCFRRSDILSRIGDSHFAVLAVDSTPEGASIVRQRLERLLDAVPKQRDTSVSVRFVTNGGMWTCSDERMTFAEFLDIVESGLRIDSLAQARA
jgi:two-component system, cell cycle response regulator